MFSGRWPRVGTDTKRVRERLLFLGTACLLCCQGSDQAALRDALPAVRDSAGVTIVTDHESARRDSPTWTVDPDPVLSIGNFDGPETSFLEAPNAAIVLAEGTTVIQNGMRGLFELRYYNNRGELTRSVGRWGEGPWEFNWVLGTYHLPGDSILVIGRDGRFAVFGPNGEGVREGRRQLPSLNWEPGALVDPRHLALEESHGIREENLLQRPRRSYRIHDLVDGTTQTVASVADAWQLVVPRPGAIGVNTYPFTPRGYFAAGSGRLWVGQSDLPEVKGFDAGGALVTLIRFTREPRRVTREDRRVWADSALAGARLPAHVRMTQSALDRMGYPDLMPYFGLLTVDRLGNLWVQRYETSWDEGPQYWDVYTREGFWTALVAIPEQILPRRARRHPAPRLEIPEIGDDYLLIQQEDSLGVRSVRRYPLQKGAAGEKPGGANPGSRMPEKQSPGSS